MRVIILWFSDLYGSNNLEAAQIDVVLDTLLDLNNRGLKIGPWFREQDETKQVSDRSFHVIFLDFRGKKYAKIRNWSNQNPNPALKPKTGNN